MAKIKGNLDNDFCPQAFYLYGTYEENGTPHFGTFNWFGWCWLSSDGEGEGTLGVMACIGEEKKTKDLIRRDRMFSANLVSEPLLPLADYYGHTSGRENPDKMKRLPTVERGQALDVPTIAESPVSLELKVVREERLASGRLGDGSANESTLFLCEVVNVTIDERLTDQSVPLAQRFQLAAPVISPGEEHYMSSSGQDLGSWGEPLKTL